MREARLLELYAALPNRWQTDEQHAWEARWVGALEEFRAGVSRHYTEGTLVRLLEMPQPTLRAASALALGLVGSMLSNTALARRLHDDELSVRRRASDALWGLWFRGAEPEFCQELERLGRFRDTGRVLRGLNVLIDRAPDFAEAVNQRAIVHFQRGEFAHSARDCEQVLRMNPYHFGAASGLGQCLLRLERPRAALEAFRNALRIHPDLDGVPDTIRMLEANLEEGR